MSERGHDVIPAAVLAILIETKAEADRRPGRASRLIRRIKQVFDR